MRIYNDMPSFQAVAAGMTALINLPVGLSYHSIIIDYKRGAGTPAAATAAQFASDIDEVRLKIDGETFLTLSGAQLNMLNAFYGVTHVDGVFPILFSRPWYRLAQSEDLFKIGTADVATFSLEIDINAAAVNPTLQAFAWQSAGEPLGSFVQLKNFPQSFAGTGGEFEISDIPRSDRYGAVAFHIGTANIDRVTMEANNRELWDKAPKSHLQHAYQNTKKPRVWQTGWWHLDLCFLNRMSDVLPMALQDFRLRLNMTGAAANFPLLMERVVSRATAAA